MRGLDRDHGALITLRHYQRRRAVLIEELAELDLDLDLGPCIRTALDAGASTRQVSAATGIHHSTIRRILEKHIA